MFVHLAETRNLADAEVQMIKAARNGCSALLGADDFEIRLSKSHWL